MPALPSVPGVVQLAFGTSLTATSHVAINRIHLHYTGTAPTAAQLASFAATALTAYGAALSTQMTADKTIVSLSAIDLSSPTGAVADVTDSIAGTLTGTELPDDTSMVMSATVARRYRGGHPRSYLPVGSAELVVSGRLWTPDFPGIVRTAWAGFITALEGAGWLEAGTIAPVNVSYYAGYHLVTFPSGRSQDVPTLRVGGPVVDLITGYVARRQLGTQRRRLAA